MTNGTNPNNQCALRWIVSKNCNPYRTDTSANRTIGRSTQPVFMMTFFMAPLELLIGLQSITLLIGKSWELLVNWF
jgi:hypothetical protein